MAWWDPADQAAAERPVLHHRDLGKGWHPVPMVNNLERLDPHGDDPASEAVRGARSSRRLTALDEGAAWRRRRDGALLVARVEVFAGDDEERHRAAWQASAAASLDAVFQARWRSGAGSRGGSRRAGATRRTVPRRCARAQRARTGWPRRSTGWWSRTTRTSRPSTRSSSTST
ncbi:MAG: hypothetical protein R2711_14655 [Acidimicrobiales bacterium]